MSSVAFFHLVFDQSSGGVERYGRILESEAGEAVVPVSYEIDLRGGANTAVPCDCQGLPMVFQLSPLHYARETLDCVRRALEANPGSRAFIIIHDANKWPLTPGAILRTGHLRTPWEAWQSLRRWRVAPKWLLSPQLDLSRTQFVVFSEGQRERLPSRLRRRAACVPHFVEKWRHTIDRDKARSKLGLSERTVLAILGYANPRKNPELALRVLARLPPSYMLVLVGGATPRMPDYPQTLDKLAKGLGVQDRFRQTGYLPDVEQAEYLAATDIGLCLFQSMSASGSLSTWISAGVPVVVSSLDEFALYEKLAPGAFLNVGSFDPDDLVRSIRQISTEQLALSRVQTESLRSSLQVPKVLRSILNPDKKT